MDTLLPRTLLALCLLLSACKPQKTPPLSGERLKKFTSLRAEGDALRAQLNFPAALAPFQQALALCDKVADAQRWSESAQRVGEGLLMLNKVDKAEALFREIIAQNEEQFGKDAIEGANGIQGLVYVLARKGNPPEMEALLRREIAIREKILFNNGVLDLSNPGNRVNFLGSLEMLETLLESSNRHKEAEPIYRKALKVEIECQLKLKNPDSKLTRYQQNYQELLLKIGDTKEQAQEKIDKIMDPLGKK